MTELLWFAAGATTFAVIRLVVARLAERAERRRDRPVVRKPAPPAPTPASAPPPRSGGVQVEDSRAMARSLAEELANLASGVEGRAHLLIEAAPDRRALPRAAEGLLRAVKRLRTLHRKIVAFALDRIPAPGRTDLGDVVTQLADDLEQLQLGLEVHWDPPMMLPPVAVSTPVVRDALVFLCSAMIRSEPGATRLTVAGEMSLGSTPRVKIELSLEWTEEAAAPPAASAATRSRHIDFEAAANLVRAQGGTIELTHMPGRFVRALVRLPAATRETLAAPLREIPRPEARTPEPPVSAPPVRHDFGGALLLESDPTVRAMVARELKATGRAVFACADTTAAKAFLENTPERFELLVVDHPRRLCAEDPLAAAIQRLSPELKIFVLDGKDADDGHDIPRAHRIPKPFGVLELREALASVLAAR